MDQGAIVALVAAHVAAHVQGTVVAAVPTLVAPGLPAVQRIVLVVAPHLATHVDPDRFHVIHALGLLPGQSQNPYRADPFQIAVNRVTVPEIARVPVTDRTIVHVRFLVPGADHLNGVSARVPTATIDKY